MIGAVEGNNSVNTISFFNATSAFNKASTVKQEVPQQDRDAGTEVKENSILRNIDVEEIKQYANSVGETNLSDEDIKYGLRFGRSVLIDYIA